MSHGQSKREIGLTHEDFSILCRADAQSPVLIKMMVGDDYDASIMARLEQWRDCPLQFCTPIAKQIACWNFHGRLTVT